MSTIRIVITDDQTLFREGLETILNLEDDIEVVGVANNGLEAVETVRAKQPDIVLMDVEMPVMNGIEGTKLIKEEFPHIHILILSTFADDDYIIDGLTHGASGYLLKDSKADLLITSVREAVTGQMMLPAPIAAKLAAKLSRSISNSPSETRRPKKKVQPSIVEGLTRREKEIGSLMIYGYSNKEIAAKLFMGEGTVRNYISVIYAKIGINDRSKAILFFREQGLDKS